MGVFMKDEDLSRSIYDYMAEVGVEIPLLVDAGLELLAGVERTKELEIALEKQIRKSLEDINVVVLIVAGIRVEEDLQNHRIHGVDVDDDPAYLYSDEVLGMAIANQIAGTKAIFNFKRYDEEKPGIIGTLGPMLDDVFAGLVAGCMSKLFEE
jgi:alpha-ribazole phosphatase CobZ